MKSFSIEKLDQLSLLILYVINSTNGRSVDEIHLQKIMFQAIEILEVEPEDVGFGPHYYGPFSDMVKESEDMLKTLGYLVEKNKKLAVNDEFKEDVSKIKLPDNVAYKVQMVSENLAKLTKDELLLLVYCDEQAHNGGKYLENSTIKERVLNNRISISMKMYRSGKVSLERSSELAGMDIRGFEDVLLKKYSTIYLD